MLLSMTGFGDARRHEGAQAMAVEVRTVNNRYLKVTTKLAEVYAALEGEIEKVIRGAIGRGTVNVTIRVDRVRTETDFRINTVAADSYWTQLKTLAETLHALPPSDLGQLLPLPGIVDEDWRRSVDIQADWVLISELLKEALTKLQVFRVDEGRSMERDLRTNVGLIRVQLDQVIERAPQVVSEQRAKMLERVRQLLHGTDSQVVESDLVREVSIFADRTDINEEITRLKCHLEQFEAFLNEKESTGRKLDFLCQELFREVNTIGSKANNVAIAHCVVEMKSAVEKIREVLQNVE